MLEVLFMEGVRKEEEGHDPIIQALKERKPEAIPLIMERIRQSDDINLMTRCSETLATLCQDEGEYYSYIEEMEKHDSQKAIIMISGYWLLPQVKDLSFFWEKLEKSVDFNEKLIYYQLLTGRFLQPGAAKKGISFVLRSGLMDYMPYYQNSLGTLLAYRGLSPFQEEVMDMNREDIIYFTGAWGEAWNMQLEKVELQGETLYPLAEDRKREEEARLLEVAVGRDTRAQFNSLLCVSSAHSRLNDLVVPYLDSPSWRVRFEALYRLNPGEEVDLIEKLWEHYRAEETTEEEKNAVISVLSGCPMDIIFDKFVKLLQDREMSLSHRFSLPGYFLLPGKEMVNRLKESSLIYRWINILRDLARDRQENFLVRYSCALILKEKLEEDNTGNWSLMEKKLFSLGRGEKVGLEEFKSYGTDVVEPLVYLCDRLGTDPQADSPDIDILTMIGPPINEKLISLARGRDVLAKVNAVRLMTIYPDNKTAETMMEMLPEAIREEKIILIRTLCQALSMHREHKIKIADFMLGLLRGDRNEDYVEQSLMIALCAMGQPRVMPLIFQRVSQGELYGVGWGTMVRAVGELCKMSSRALELVGEKAAQDQPYRTREFASQVYHHLVREKEKAQGETGAGSSPGDNH